MLPVQRRSREGGMPSLLLFDNLNKLPVLRLDMFSMGFAPADPGIIYGILSVYWEIVCVSWKAQSRSRRKLVLQKR